MCGIVALITDPTGIPFTLLESMTEAIAHRGPDSHGYAWVSPDGKIRSKRTGFPSGPLPGVVFGHRRLSILDPSPAGHQPILSRTSPLVMAYNGEIHNYVELREELRLAGHRFQSTSDTEVVLAAYEQWGTAAFPKFNGMWAIALWDGRRQTLVISRDRFGIKPLYHATVQGHRIFASEIKALLRFPGIDRGIAEEQVLDFLKSGLSDHTNATLFRSIESVPPGSVWELNRHNENRRHYWRLSASSARLEGTDTVHGYRQLLQDAVRVRSRSDVPIGTMLSGGLDSTSITAMIVAQSRQRTDVVSEAFGLNSFHHTFTACWPDASAIDEEGEVDLMCRELDLHAEKLYPSAEAVGSLLEHVTHMLDAPFESPVAVVQFMLMQRARERGVKVVLNGHGADEVLAGYPDIFVAPFLAGLLLRGQPARFASQRRAFAPWNRATSVIPEIIWAFTPEVLRPSLARATKRTRDSRPGVFVQGNPSPWSRHEAEAAVHGRLSPLDAALWRNFQSLILPQWLRMEDRVSMAHGVESRLPFLDHRVVEYSFQMADSMKLNDGYTKSVLRQAMQHLLPASIALDRRKRRFSAPYWQWFKGPWQGLLRDLFANGGFEAECFVDKHIVRDELRGLGTNRDTSINPSTLWRLLQTEIWMRNIKQSQHDQ